MTDRSTLAEPTPTSRVDGRSRFRPEIQALRAVAVLGVVVYHFFPAQLPGGYAGVDVFFVISGFLITGHLMRELTSSGRISLGAFYARRARRLLPAAFLVLAASAVLAVTLLGPHHWQRVAIEIGASALYIENWALAQAAVDYLSPTTEILSPVQHYWSLSVEEQFYLVWPLLLLVVWLLAAKLSASHRQYVLMVTLATVFTASLALSIVQTATAPSLAYFATTTRAWEFAAGGLLALLLRESDARPVARSLLSWLGLAAIAVCFFVFDDRTPFPGYTALLPVVGTALVIAAGSPRLWWSPRAAMAVRPVRYLGDVSYSLYLWHWPLAIAVVALVTDPGPVIRFAAVALSLVLAAATRRFVESPAQRARFLTSKRPRFTLGVTAVAMALIVASVGGAIWSIGRATASDLKNAALTVRESPPCLGAAAVAEGCSIEGSGSPPIPGVLAAAGDAAVTPECWGHAHLSQLIVCSAGPAEHPALRVALVGDSHANNYQDTLEVLAREYGWRVDFIGKSSCPWSTIEREYSAAWNTSCQSWVRSLTEHVLTGGYDLVITSSAVGDSWKATPGRTVEQSLADGFVGTWSPVAAAGIPIVAIKDIPRAMPGYLDCIHAHPTTATTACALPQGEAFAGYDAQSAAAERVKGVTVLDYTRYFCQSGRCPAVIGGVIVYRNNDHLTGTYAATLAPMLRSDVLTATGLIERPRG
ncbi:acyltransferase [Leifsonia shinshuensis]|uniref:acyltransferase family protein n=1 Tax=Leifsonia shinshuensis TaxID=150026 RepID=UPI001F5096CF|nr:acyltransferase family protein [Leifsonia shinshuensis]MCI0159186.1 acyltransferase [Leifsonia shinshuensis]